MSGEKAYLDLLQKVLDNGEKKRNSKFNNIFSFEKQEFDISEKFPLLTTKEFIKVGVMKELLWFLRCDTNSKHSRG